MTPLIGAADLTWMRQTPQQIMPNTALVIYRMATVADGRIYTTNSRAFAEQEAGGQLISTTRWYATMPTGTDVTAKDRLGANGRKWLVTSVNNDQDWQTAVRCEVQSLNEDAP